MKHKLFRKLFKKKKHEEQTLWTIDHLYLDEYTGCDGTKGYWIQVDASLTILDTEKNVKKFIEDDSWNPPCLKDEITGKMRREYEAEDLMFAISELNDDLKAILIERKEH